jgi:hypothetical protein
MVGRRKTMVRAAVIHRTTYPSTIYRGQRKADVQPRRSGIIFAVGEEVEGGDVGVSAHIGRGASESHRIG